MELIRSWVFPSVERIRLASSMTSTDMKRFGEICVLDESPQAAVADPRAEIELLLCCARTSIDSKTLERLRTLLRQDMDWPRLIQMAGSHGVRPLLYRSLSFCSPDAVPKAVLDRLRESFRSNAQRSLFLTAELHKLLDLFAVHGINVIPFKGPILAASVYKDLSLRPFGDLDVLVSRDDILKAGGLLASLGYQPTTGKGVALEQDPEDVAYVGPKFYVFVHRDHGARVDLQWRVTQRYFSFSLEENHARGRLVRVMVAGRSVLTFAPMDLLLILCAHGAKHQWQRMKWICDVAELVRTEKEKIDWGKLQQEASRQGMRRMLSLGLILARNLLGAELPVEVAKVVERDFGGGSVVSRIVSKLFTESTEPFGDSERVIFYLRMMDRWQDRVRFCSNYLSQCLRDVAIPTSKEHEFFSLPAPLSFLYYFFRPLRLAGKYLWLAFSQLSAGKRSAPAKDSPHSGQSRRDSA